MREIAEIELAIQGGTEKIEQLGEQGKVDESMREMAAIEALKSEKADKEVRGIRVATRRIKLTYLLYFSGNFNNLQTRQVPPATRNSVFVTFVVHTCPSSIQIVVSPTTSVVRLVFKPISFQGALPNEHVCRCIWAITNCVTCSRSSRKNGTNVRWARRRPSPRALPVVHPQVLVVLLHEVEIANSATATEATSATRRAMSKSTYAPITTFKLTLASDRRRDRERSRSPSRRRY